MGLMRFLVPRRDLLPADADQRAYITGLDELPWQSRTQWMGDQLVVRRAESDSGCFHIPWNVSGAGELTLATACLMERDQPYHLPVELARGSVHRLRNQIAAWQAIGLVVPENVSSRLSTALAHLSRAATSQHDPATATLAADQAINEAHLTVCELIVTYAQQSLTSRARQTTKVTKLLGVNLGSSPLKESLQKEVLTAINAATVPMSWREIEPREGKRDWTNGDRQIEWCRTNGLMVCPGPLVQLNRSALPDWLYLWEGDFDNLASFAADHIRSVINRYKGKVALWQCGARMNASEIFSLTEEQRLRLAVLSLETTRQADPRVPVVLWIDQPWAEFMSRQNCDLSPLHFADALVRADLGLAGLNLEINLGYYPGGTQPRDLLDFSRLIDRWSCLGLPLLVTLTIPSGSTPDPLASSQARVLPMAPGGQVSVASQWSWAGEILPLLLSKQAVQGVMWNQLLDSQPHEFAHGGLFDQQNHGKPALTALQTARRQYLG